MGNITKAFIEDLAMNLISVGIFEIIISGRLNKDVFTLNLDSPYGKSGVWSEELEKKMHSRAIKYMGVIINIIPK